MSIGESQFRASQAGPSTQKIHPCEMCIPASKDILHHAEPQARCPWQKPCLGGTCVRCFSFHADLHQQQRHGSGAKPWKRDVDRASCLKSCNIFVSGQPFTCRKVGEDFPATSGLLQHQTTPNSEEPHRGNQSGQAFHSGKSHYSCCECEKAVRHNHALDQPQSVCSGEGLYECGRCGKTFSCNYRLVRHQQIDSGQRPYEIGRAHV